MLVHVILFHLLTTVAESSRGDQNDFYAECLKTCKSTSKCQHESQHRTWIGTKSWNICDWECEQECKYSCMWVTVDKFHQHNMDTPQFYGKWPFARLGGIQEPASVVFSILNGFAHIYSLRLLRKSVHNDAPTYLTWHGYCLVALNTWAWSTIFHIRDVDFTEKMDYFCATALVTYQLFGLFSRILVGKPKIYIFSVAIVILSLCSYHIYQMGYIHFDYGYHIKVNVAIGTLNAIGWLLWCGTVYRRQPYVWRGAVSVLLIGALLSLEVFDFPPIWWVFDAHALWHAGTVPVTILWYRFLIDDCHFMLKQKSLHFH